MKVIVISKLLNHGSKQQCCYYNDATHFSDTHILMIFVSTTAQVTVVWITSGEGEDQQFRLAEYFTYD